ncbi:DUF3786 domain-containing protein [Deltaproteobacteria bacterium OttesenSCG-928-K17]|nr:DUF3786 domain-containing protein [Deltaproteobacteria bacterium OttesenSCG-928-K17]
MRVDDYKNAARLSAIELAGRDPRAVAEASGAEWDGSRFRMLFFGRLVEVRAPEMSVAWADQQAGEDFSLTDAVLVLHYLEGAKGQAPTGEMVAYRQLSGGEFYWDAFHRRAEEPLAKTFGNSPGLLNLAVTAFGGEPVSGYGDEAGKFRVLPHLNIIVQIYLADDEFESTGQVLFDRLIGDYMPIEDVSWLGSALVYRLMGTARNLKG